MEISFRLLFSLCILEYFDIVALKNCTISKTSLNFADVQSLHFTEKPSDTTFLNTRKARIECKARGVPRPSISWETSDGKAVGNITNIRQVNYDGSLEFPSFEAKNLRTDVHRTEYRCIAQSSLGKLRSETIKVYAGMKKLILHKFIIFIYLYKRP